MDFLATHMESALCFGSYPCEEVPRFSPFLLFFLLPFMVVIEIIDAGPFSASQLIMALICSSYESWAML